ADIVDALGDHPVLIARTEAERAASVFTGDVVLEDAVGTEPGMRYAIGIGENAVRERVARRFPDLDFATLIHPSASFGIGQRDAIAARRGTIVCAGVRFTNHIEVGDF